MVTGGGLSLIHISLKESLVKMIYSNPGGVPHILHVDNGKDYTAKAMTGQNRKHRKIDLDFAFDSEKRCV